jgi:predicted transcriptional regulator
MGQIARTANNSKYRSRLQIVADILFVVGERESTKKTRIMYQANLSYDLLKRYLAETIEAGLIRVDKDKRSYTLTRKGEQFLEKFKKYAERCAKLQKQFDGARKHEIVLEKMCSNTGDENK